MYRSLAMFAAVCCLTAGVVPRASAQNHTQTARSFARAPQVIGMGDAGVAFATKHTTFFYNPAHLAHIRPLVPHVTLAGVSTSLSGHTFDQISFFERDIKPAIDAGFDNLDNERLSALYRDTFAEMRQPSTIRPGVLLPSLQLRIGPVGAGLGLFANSSLDYHIEDAGFGVPHVDLAGRVDVMGVASVGVDLGLLGLPLSVGVTGKYTQRYLTFKSKPLDAFSSEETFDVVRGEAFGFDVGVQHEVGLLPLPGTLTVGAAVYDLAGTGFAYEYDAALNEHLNDATLDAAEAEALVASVEEDYRLTPSYRVGLAYKVPGLFIFKNTGVALDYVGYQKPRTDQSFLTHLHLGAQARLLFLNLRTGFNQGYLTAGAGLSLGFVHLDYTYYGQENGRFPGQLPSWNHMVQVRLGIF